MIPTCSQRLDNGKTCNAPAMNGSRFCRHHDSQRPRPAQENSPETEPLHLPLIVDKQSALAAINVVLQAVSSGRTKRSVAQTLLSAIRFAARLIDEIANAGQTVLPVARYPRPASVALAASGNPPRVGDCATAKLPPHAYDADVDPATARIVRELMAQSRELAKIQKPAISRP